MKVYVIIADNNYSDQPDLVCVKLNQESAEKYVTEQNDRYEKIRNTKDLFFNQLNSYQKNNPVPDINNPPKPRQNDFSDMKAFGQAMRAYNVGLASHKHYKENYQPNLDKFKEDLARELSDGEFSAEKIEGFLYHTIDNYRFYEVEAD